MNQYIRPGLSKGDVSNIFLVFTNLQEENDLPDEVKLDQVRTLPFFQESNYIDRLVDLSRQNMESVGNYGYSSGADKYEQSYRDDGLDYTRSPRTGGQGGFGCMGCCNGMNTVESAKLIGPPPEKANRGIKRGQAGNGSRRRGNSNNDLPWITFDQFFEVMSESMTRGMADNSPQIDAEKDVQDSGIQFESQEQNVSCFFMPIFGKAS